jgi:sensor histidine kinase regulating citrate/malate metabolism
VGNEILDAILNYYLPSLKENVKISVTGKCIGNIKVSNMDLCTIFSNLIQNAVEEVAGDSTNEKELYVWIQEGKSYLQIEIINSISDVHEATKENFFKSYKDDIRNHGIGLRNVKNTLERNGGVLELRKENNKFIATVIIEK